MDLFLQVEIFEKCSLVLYLFLLLQPWCFVSCYPLIDNYWEVVVLYVSDNLISDKTCIHVIICDYCWGEIIFAPKHT